jgi:uncharacterized membrane protein
MRIWLFFHLLGVILWAGGALSLSRVLGFHVEEDPLAVQPRLSAIELRLFNFAVMPGMLLAMGTGWGMISGAAQQDMQFRWMWVKLGLAMLLFLLTMLLFKRIQDLAEAPAFGKKGRHMALHGVIGLCVLGILWMVLVRPF